MTQVPLGKAWINSTDRRQYQGIIFSPGGNLEGHYNMWRGFSCEPKKGDWSLMRDHIHRIICSGNEQQFRWLMAWLADIVQNPGGDRPGTAIVMRGIQGTGKGIFVKYYGQIFASHFKHLTKTAQLVGRFNGHLKECLLVFLDEALWTGDKAAQGALKGIITEEELPIEFKGKDIIQVKNRMRVVIASNNDWVIPADLEERRFAFFDVSPDRAGDRAYFDAIVHELDTGGREAMLFDLLSLDISDIDLRAIPRTKGLLDQMLRSADGFTRFWFDVLQSGTLQEINPFSTGWPDNSGLVPTKRFYDAYKSFAADIKERNMRIDSQVGVELNKLCPGVIKKRPTIKEAGDWKRQHLYVFPPLEECRKAFETKVGMSIDWGDDFQ